MVDAGPEPTYEEKKRVPPPPPPLGRRKQNASWIESLALLKACQHILPFHDNEPDNISTGKCMESDQNSGCGMTNEITNG